MTGEKQFDGIICFGGEDWWYHNRGHFDFQILRRLARQWPVLYVNSLGVRFPSPVAGTEFARKISRKLNSIGRGLTHVENNFWVFSPLNMPGRAGRYLTNWAVGPQVRLAARRAGINRPLAWVHCPSGQSHLSALNPVATIMQRTDRFECFAEASGQGLDRTISQLKQTADLAIYCNDELLLEETDQVRASCLVTHGVDYERFASAGASGVLPNDVAKIDGPRIGFIGGIDAHTFNPSLFLDVAGRLSGHSFVMVGGCSLGDNWCGLPNVHMLGRKPYERIADYMASCDVLIMPWADNEWIRACNPIKLKEYLAVGRPVVTTDFPALAPYRNLVRTADDAPTFADAIRQALSVPFDAAPSQRSVRSQTWDNKVDDVRQAIGQLGLSFSSTQKAAYSNSGERKPFLPTDHHAVG